MKKKDLHKKAGNFKVPEGYFERFEDRLFDNIRKENTLPEDDGYIVPKHYFEDFENRLFQKLHQKKERKVIKLSTYKKIYYTLAAAAAMFVLFIGIKSVLPGLTDDPISLTDVEAYIDNGYMALNSYDIAEIFEDETLEITSISGASIDDEKLIDYLHENLDNYNDLAIEN